MNRRSAQKLLDQFAGAYRDECHAIAYRTPGPDSCDFPGGDQLAAERWNDGAIRYMLAVQPLYDRTRRAIGHIGGVLVLAQLSGRRDFLDQSALAVTLDQWCETSGQLKAVDAPGGLARHFADLERSHLLVGEILHDLNATCIHGSWKEHFERGTQKIKAAYSYLQNASILAAGMMMIDHTHNCCNCARLHYDRRIS